MRTFTYLLFTSLFLSLLLSATTASGQPPVDFQLKEMSKGSFTSLVINIPEANAKVAQKEWKAFLKNYKGKVKKSKPETYKALNVKLASINGSDVVNVYADFEEKGENLDAYVWFEADNQFVSSKSSESDIENAKAILQNFYYNVREKVVEQQIKDQEKVLAKAEKAQKQLEKDLTKYEKAIEKAKKMIAENEANIEQNARDQQQAKELISTEEANLSDVKKKFNNVKSEGKN